MSENENEEIIIGGSEAEEPAGPEHETVENSSEPEQEPLGGKVRIAEDVISQIAVKALSSVEGITPAAPGLMANLRMGRKAVSGIRISLSEAEPPEIQIDAYVTIKYGLRIPDVCLDVQEAVKGQVEQFTGYKVTAVDVYVQGVTFEDGKHGGEETDGGGEEPSEPGEI